MEKLNFIQCASLGIHTVLEQYPSALLLEIDSAKSQGASLNPDDLDSMRIVFAYQDVQTIVIESSSFDSFGEPLLIDEPFGGNVPIKNWPVKMDLAEALELIREAGFEKPFSTVTLRHPMIKGAQHPVYTIADNPMDTQITVNTVTMEVTETQNLLGSQWMELTICVYGCDIKGELNVTCGTEPKDGNHTRDYKDGCCTSGGKWGNFNGWSMVGASGELTLKDKVTDDKICLVKYESPYSGSNKFEVTDENKTKYNVQVTSKGNTGRSGCLGNCSMNVFKL